MGITATIVIIVEPNGVINTLLCAANFDKMKLKFDATKGNRLNSQMTGFEAVNCDWLWNYDLKEWTQEVESGKYGYSSHRPCKSVKAFRRMLKKAPKGVEFKLWNKYVGYNVYGTGCA